MRLKKIEDEERISQEVSKRLQEVEKQKKDDDKKRKREEPEPMLKKKSQPRPICQYGIECYRKNPQHFKEMSHPGNAKEVPGD